MANCQFTNSSGTGAYIFAQNPELPYQVKTLETGYSRARLANGSLKVYIGVDKKNFELDFVNITKSQVDSMVAFYIAKKYFRFYEDSAISATYFNVWFKSPPDFSKDENDSTYSGKISIEEI